MRLSASEKYEIIQTVTQSKLGVKKTLQELGIAKSTFYKWYSKYLDGGYDGLSSKKTASNRQWNRIPQQQKDLVVQVALDGQTCLHVSWPITLPTSNRYSSLNQASIAYSRSVD